jgi:myo-inositol-hexaphosphate 3-phosphohydrolase
MLSRNVGTRRRCCRAVALVLGLGAIGAMDAGVPTARAAAVQVAATMETDPVSSGGDAADDPAIWIHPTDPALSTIIGTDKTATGGLVVYDLSGRRLFFYADGRYNNVDVAYNFPLGSEPVALVATTNRAMRRIDFTRSIRRTAHSNASARWRRHPQSPRREASRSITRPSRGSSTRS